MTKQCEHKFGTAKIKCFFGHDVELKTIIDNAIKKHDIKLKSAIIGRLQKENQDGFFDELIDDIEQIWKKRGM